LRDRENESEIEMTAKIRGVSVLLSVLFIGRGELGSSVTASTMAQMC
jgi:hypothetical protein